MMGVAMACNSYDQTATSNTDLCSGQYCNESTDDCATNCCSNFMCMDLRYCRTKQATIGLWVGVTIAILLIVGIVIGVCVHSHRNRQNQDDMLAAKL